MNHEFKNKIKARLYEQLLNERQEGPGLIDTVGNQISPSGRPTSNQPIVIPPNAVPKPAGNPGLYYDPIRNPQGYNPADPYRNYTDWEKPRVDWPSTIPTLWHNPFAIPPIPGRDTPDRGRFLPARGVPKKQV